MKNKPFKCRECQRQFTTKQGFIQHTHDVHGLSKMEKSVRVEIAHDVFDDLPDGAFFAAAQSEFGLEPEDFIEEK